MNDSMKTYLNSLTTVSDARYGRASSWDQTGRNKDYWLLAPGTTTTLAELDGPGCINHIWMTSFCRRILGPSIQHPVYSGCVAPVTEMENAEGVNWEINDLEYYRKVLIRMSWENSEKASVLAPLGDFFCIGNAMPKSFSSIPFNISSRPVEECTPGGTASMNCYFPMPFNEHAKIQIINENDRPVGLFFHIDYELYREKLDNIAYFHACWKRVSRCDGWGDDICVNTPEINGVPNLDGKNNYVFLDVDGTGHYVGCNLSVVHFQGAWWGEGDDMIFIDGEEQPSVNGTGSEDYFNHAWGMQKNQSPYNGTIIHESESRGCQVSYRFHITDPVHFKTHIKVTMEHGHANHLSDDWASTAYWYQTMPFSGVEIQPVEERLPRRQSYQLSGRAGMGDNMTPEMSEARAHWAERNIDFAPKKTEQERLNSERTAESSRNNVAAARRLREDFDRE